MECEIKKKGELSNEQRGLMLVASLVAIGIVFFVELELQLEKFDFHGCHYLFTVILFNLIAGPLWYLILVRPIKKKK